MRGLAVIATASGVGVVGWSGVTLMLPLALAFPWLWAAAPSRLAAAGVAAGYFLGASRGLPQGVMAFFDTGLASGIALWALASSAFVGVHTVLWSRRADIDRLFSFGLASILMAVPPFGIIGWAHPLTSAGVIFPGTGWAGVALAAGAMIALTTRYWRAAALAVGVAWLCAAASWTPPPSLPGWTSVDTMMGASLGQKADLEHHRALLAATRGAANSGERVAVLPESAFGFWTPTVARFWIENLRQGDLAVVGGAAIVDPAGYDNALVEIDGNGARVAYRQRMPVPVSMWQPWRAWLAGRGGARAYLFQNPVVIVGGRKIAPLICYEQLIVWPVLQSMLHAPDAIVATGNAWWTANTSIAAIQRASAQAWARLFDRPLVIAFNL